MFVVFVLNSVLPCSLTQENNVNLLQGIQYVQNKQTNKQTGKQVLLWPTYATPPRTLCVVQAVRRSDGRDVFDGEDPMDVACLTASAQIQTC